MKRKVLFLPLVILVALFLSSAWMHGTSAYFIDQKTIDGQIKLQMGTLTLGECQPSKSEVILGDKEEEIELVIQNTGTLIGKVQPLIKAEPSGEQLRIDYTLDKESQQLAGGASTTLRLKFNQQDWDEAGEKLVTVRVQLKQANLKADRGGFSDEKTVQILVKREKKPTTSWPSEDQFENQMFIERNLYYSVVNQQLTTVVPGVVFLEYRKGETLTERELEAVKKHLTNKITTKIPTAKPNSQGETESYLVKELVYVEKQGFKLVLELKPGIKREWQDYSWLRINIAWFHEEYLPYRGEEQFGLPVLIDTDINQDGRPQVGAPIELKGTEPLTLKLYTLAKQQDPLSARLPLNLAAYFEKNIEAVMETSAVSFEWGTAYESFTLTAAESSTKRIRLDLVKGGQVVFSREIKIEGLPAEAKTDLPVDSVLLSAEEGPQSRPNPPEKTAESLPQEPTIEAEGKWEETFMESRASLLLEEQNE
ncbi:hypothetical protein ACYSNO_09385 [Enterococcus sp. LJL98]